jgi:hypothetical protein
MPTDAPFEECEAIILEYKRACLELWLDANQETRDACRAIRHLMGGGSDAEAACPQALLRPFEPFRGPVSADAKKVKTPIAEVIHRKFEHQAKTGHYVKFPLAKPSSSDLS